MAKWVLAAGCHVIFCNYLKRVATSYFVFILFSKLQITLRIWLAGWLPSSSFIYDLFLCEKCLHRLYHTTKIEFLITTFFSHKDNFSAVSFFIVVLLQNNRNRWQNLIPELYAQNTVRYVLSWIRLHMLGNLSADSRRHILSW